MRVIINGTRYDLTGMKRLGYSTFENGGVTIENVWYGPRSKRLIVESHSIWEKGTHGEIVGQTFAVYEPGDDEYGWWIEKLDREGCELPDAPLPEVSEEVSENV